MYRNQIWRSVAAVAIFLALVSVLFGTIASHGSGTAAKTTAPPMPLGLYRVLSRECNFEPGAPEECTTVQYMEFVSGIAVDLPDSDRALITWLATDPSEQHTYTVRVLDHSHWSDTGTLVIQDSKAGREWFVIRSGRPSDYVHERNAHPGAPGLTGTSKLKLEQVERDTTLDILLHHPAW